MKLTCDCGNGHTFITPYDGAFWLSVIPTRTNRTLKKHLDNHPLFPLDRGPVAAVGGQPSIKIPGIETGFTAIKLPNGKIWDTINGWRTKREQ